MKTEEAIFAAGCFWGVQFYFDQVPGVVRTVVGYIGGHTENPTYEEVCSHATGHAEAVRIVFDPEQVSYKTLVQQFFRMHDPTQRNRQGPDIGDEYRTAIFYLTDTQRTIAEQVRSNVQTTLNKQVVTEITLASTFYEAEAYHQKFSERTGIGMCHIPYEPIKDDTL